MSESDDALNLVPAPVDRDVFSEDTVLVEAVERHEAKAHLVRLRDLGRLAGAARSLQWAEAVEQFPPILHTHDSAGRRLDEVEYHPAWHRLTQTGVRAGLTAGPWEIDAPPASHTARAAALIVWSQLETGHISALSTSYAAIPALRSDDTLETVWLPRLASRSYESGLRPPGDKLGCLAGVAATDGRAARTCAAPPRWPGQSPTARYPAGRTTA